MGKRLGKLLFAGLLAVSMLAGCGKKATPEGLLTDSVKRMLEVKSMEGNLKADVAVSAQGMTVNLAMDFDTAAIMKTQEASMTGKIEFELLGSNMNMDIEAYNVLEGGVMTTYTKMLDQWQKLDVEAQEQDTGIYKDMLEKIRDAYSSFSLSEKLVKVEDKDCFELKGEVSGEVLMMALNNQNSLGDTGLEEMLPEDMLKGLTIPCTFCVYKKEVLPAKITFDMTDAMKSLLAETGEEGSVDKAYLEVIYKGFDTVKEIKVPAEAKNAV